MTYFRKSNQIELKKVAESDTYGNVAGSGQDTIDGGFSERIEGSFWTSHEIRL